MGSQSQPPPLPLPTNTRTHVFASPYPTYQRKAFTTTSLRLAYKIVSAFVLVRALGFLRLNLTCPMDTRALLQCIQDTVWAQVSGVQGLF